MENKSLNPVCVNNRNVFSWSHICNCYFEQTADGRIVNIPTSSPDRLSMPCLQWGTCCCKGWLWRGSRRTTVAHGLAPVPSHFWAAALFFCSLALLASFTLGPISRVLPPWLPAVFPGTWSCDRSGSNSSWSWCQCCFLSCLARLAAAQAHPLPRASPSLPAHPAAAAAPQEGGGLCKWWKWKVSVPFMAVFCEWPSPTPGASTPGLWHGWKWCLVSVLSCTHLGGAMRSFDTRRLNDSGCLCFCVTLVSVC